MHGDTFLSEVKCVANVNMCRLAVAFGAGMVSAGLVVYEESVQFYPNQPENHAVLFVDIYISSRGWLHRRMSRKICSHNKPLESRRSGSRVRALTIILTSRQL